MKIAFTIILIFLLSIYITSQEKIHKITHKGSVIYSDVFGNSYTAGEFDDPTLKFGDYILVNKGNNDVFIAKYDLKGKIVWAKNLGSKGYVRLEDFSVNDNGEINLKIKTNSELSAFQPKADQPLAEEKFSLTQNKSAIYLIKVNSEGNFTETEIIREENKANLNKIGSFITLTYPVGGENLLVGTNRNITWTYSGLFDDNLLIEYSTNDGNKWNYITIIPAFFNSHNWIVPVTVSTQTRVKISVVSDTSINSTSSLFTIEGELNWFQQSSGTSSILRSIYFIDENTGWAAGFDGILKTSNGGATWIQQLSGYGLLSINFYDENLGFAVGLGGAFLTTINGGENWVEHNNFNRTLTEVQFINPNYGWTVGDTLVYSTTDGGFNWTSSSLTDHILSTIFFTDTLKGWAAGGEGVIFKTEDGGNSWTQQISPGTLYNQFNSVYFIDENIGWVCGSGLDVPGGVILKTTNGGNSWCLTSSGWNTFLFSINFSGTNNGWASGDRGLLLHSTNCGIDWSEKGSGINKDLFSINFSLNENGLTSGSDGIILKHSTNIAAFSWWMDLNINTANGNNDELVLGQSNYGTDGIDLSLGETEIPNLPAYGIFDVRFQLINSKHTKADFRNSIDEEITWQIKIQPGLNGYPVYLSWNSGDLPEGNFRLKNSGDSSILNIDMKLVDSCMIDSSLNSNLFIEYIADPVPVELSSFTASYRNNSAELLWETISEKNNKGFEIERLRGGSSTIKDWERIGFVNGKGTTTEKQNYSFIDAGINSGKYIYRLKQIDFDGTYKYSNEVEIEIASPIEFELSQNYPNPFNPATNIEFRIAYFGLVTLKIYDVLGKEVATLVNEEKPAGKYEIEFDASSAGLASGVYIYKLTTGSMSISKKMILLR